MIIEVPFCYEANALPPRARSARKVAVLDRLALNIREVAPAEFPVAARIRRRFDADARPVHSDGRLFYMPSHLTGSERRPPLPPSELEALVPGDYEAHWRHPLASAARVHMGDKAVPVAGIADYRVVSDDRRERVAEIVRRAADLVLCDGVVYDECGEPCWKFVNGWTVEAALSGRETAEEPDSFWRADKLCDLAERHPDGTEPNRLGEIEVLRPDLLRLAPEAAALRQRAAEAMGYVSGGDLKTATKAWFSAYADLRDALAETPAGEVSEPLVDAVLAWLECDEKGWGPGRRLADAYERWKKAFLSGADDELDLAVPRR
jgi:hypothetical protein